MNRLIRRDVEYRDNNNRKKTEVNVVKEIQRKNKETGK